MPSRLFLPFSAAAALAAFVLPAWAADHREAPLISLRDAADLTDVFVFVSPADAGRTVLILTASPLLAPDGQLRFHPSEYRVNIDHDDDEKADVVVSWKFGDPGDAAGQPYLLRIERPTRGDAGAGQSLRRPGRVGEVLALPGEARAFAGPQDDPFFFDGVGFVGETTGAGERRLCDGQQTDSFAGMDVAAMVLELPSRALTAASPVIHVWAEARSSAAVDRMGNPAINTLYVPEGRKDAFNATKPRQHAHRWSDVVEETLLVASAAGPSPYDRAQAAAIAAILLPDVLTFDTTSREGYVPGFNGRRVDDDVMDYQLKILTGGFYGGEAAFTGDCIDGNDVPLPEDFPYLAPPHAAGVPGQG